MREQTLNDLWREVRTDRSAALQLALQPRPLPPSMRSRYAAPVPATGYSRLPPGGRSRPSVNRREADMATLEGQAQGPMRNQFAEAGAMALETTGLPGALRANQALRAGDYAGFGGEALMGGLNLLGTMAAVRPGPAAGALRAAPEAPPRPPTPPARQWVRAYHGTDADIEEFRPGSFFSEQPGTANYYALNKSGQNGRVYPVLIDVTDAPEVSAWGRSTAPVYRMRNIQDRTGEGTQSAYFDQWVVNDPSRVRFAPTGIEEAAPRPPVTQPSQRPPTPPARQWGRASDGSVLPIREPQPMRQSFVGGSDDLREAAGMRPGLPALSTMSQREDWAAANLRPQNRRVTEFRGPQDTRYGLSIEDTPQGSQISLENRTPDASQYGRADMFSGGEARNIFRRAMAAIEADMARNGRPEYLLALPPGHKPQHRRVFEAMAERQARANGWPGYELTRGDDGALRLRRVADSEPPRGNQRPDPHSEGVGANAGGGGRYSGGMTQVSPVQTVDPRRLTFREADQHRLDEVRAAFPPGRGYAPIVTAGDVILDGHNRARIAIERGETIPRVEIDPAIYRRLQAAGFDEMDIAHWALGRAGQDEAASAIRRQFAGADFFRSEQRIEAIVDANNAPPPGNRPPPPGSEGVGADMSRRPLFPGRRGIGSSADDARARFEAMSTADLRSYALQDQLTMPRLAKRHSREELINMLVRDYERRTNSGQRQ